MKKNIRRLIDKGASKVANASGGRDLVDYLGTRIAQRKNASIKQTTTGRQALKSAGKVGVTMATLVGGFAPRMVKAVASRGAAKKVAKKVTENALDRKYRLQDEYDYAQREAQKLKKKKK